MAEVYGSLAETASSNSERIELLQKCRQAAHDQEQSPAIWLLREIPLQLAEGNGTRVSEIIQVIQAQHMQEPGIAEQLYSLLVQMGILNPDGTPTTAAAAGSDGIWTPDGSTTSSEQVEGDKKSSIWVPGMD
jgi:hypothetical protein